MDTIKIIMMICICAFIYFMILNIGLPCMYDTDEEIMDSDMISKKSRTKMNKRLKEVKEKFEDKNDGSIFGENIEEVADKEDIDTVPETDIQKEKYSQDFYPWWRTPRWWLFDGWLYNRPYYNYWRRPSYYNMWFSGNPIVIGGKRYYKTNY